MTMRSRSPAETTCRVSTTFGCLMRDVSSASSMNIAVKLSSEAISERMLFTATSVSGAVRRLPR